MAREILFIAHNHFDPTWRRCFDRPATRNGVTVRSYADIEERCFDGWLELAPRGYTYSEGQTAIWRKYLERNPERLDALKAEAAAGRLDVMLAGETVQDSNMPTAEGLVRNFLTAMPLYREMVGERFPGLKLAWLEDAFGNSPNYPQVLRGVGAEVVCFTCYRRVPEDVWVGIDGTSILCIDQIPIAGSGSCEKYPPCPSCKGEGCEECGGLGLYHDFGGFSIDGVRAALNSAIAAEGEVAVAMVHAEEFFPDSRVADLVAEMNAAADGRYRIRFATPTDVYSAFKGRLLEYAANRDSTPTPELNPAMPGCMVSRIACKQRTRGIAYRLLSAESRLANRAWAIGKPTAPPEEFARAWRLVAFNQFHDAITGTHIDHAYTELMEMLDEAESVVSEYAPPVRPEGVFAAPEVESATMKLGELDVVYDRRGIVSVLHDGRDVFGVLPFTRMRRPFRIGELVLEADFGDAWGQRIEPMGGPLYSHSQIQLGDYHTGVSAAADAIRWTGVYTGGDPKVNKLEWTVTARASEDGRRIDFVTEVDWDTESRRLRALFPVASHGDTATYEVPFGFIDRKFDPSQLNYGQWAGNSLEFPALHWARKDVDATSGVAILNRGLPCYRWMPGRMDVSLLRSPEWEFCAEENAHYEFHDIEGQKDAGFHRLEYSARPFYDGLSNADLTREGYAYNAPLFENPPFVIEGDVVVTAWKPAEDGAGWTLRLQEANGRAGSVRLTFDEPHRVTETDLLERSIADGRTGSRFEYPIHKHGILTLYIQ